jgi:biotin carboxyl carrier protein
MKRAMVTDRVSGDVAAEVGPDAVADPRDTLVLTSPSARTASDGVGHLRLEVVVDGWRFEYEVEDADRAALRARATRGRDHETQHGPTQVRAIIPGRVVAVAVAAGDAVTAGQQLLTVEAMKMQNELRSPRDGVVDRVAVEPGATVEPGDLLLTLA